MKLKDLFITDNAIILNDSKLNFVIDSVDLDAYKKAFDKELKDRRFNYYRQSEHYADYVKKYNVFTFDQLNEQAKITALMYQYLGFYCSYLHTCYHLTNGKAEVDKYLKNQCYAYRMKVNYRFMLEQCKHLQHLRSDQYNLIISIFGNCMEYNENGQPLHTCFTFNYSRHEGDQANIYLQALDTITNQLKQGSLSC